MTGSSTIALKVFVHIPDTRLMSGVEIPHAGGVLRAIEYAEWEMIDREISEKRQRIFEANRPCFYVRLISASREEPVIDSEQALDADSFLAAVKAENALWRAIAGPALESGIDAANEVRLALALMSGEPTRSIEESISYVTDGKTTSRQVGRLERRAILDNRPEILIFESNAEQIGSILELVTAAKPATRLGEFAQALAILGSTALPDFEHIDGLVQTALALESILLADVTTGVTAAFVERGAALLANDASEIPALRATLQAVYALRSDALHGRECAQTPEAAGHTFGLWRWTRRALTHAMTRILHVCRGAADCPGRLIELRTELEAARTTLTIPTMLADAPACLPLGLT